MIDAKVTRKTRLTREKYIINQKIQKTHIIHENHINQENLATQATKQAYMPSKRSLMPLLLDAAAHGVRPRCL